MGHIFLALCLLLIKPFALAEDKGLVNDLGVIFPNNLVLGLKLNSTECENLLERARNIKVSFFGDLSLSGFVALAAEAYTRSEKYKKLTLALESLNKEFLDSKFVVLNSNDDPTSELKKFIRDGRISKNTKFGLLEDGEIIDLGLKKDAYGEITKALKQELPHSKSIFVNDIPLKNAIRSLKTFSENVTDKNFLSTLSDLEFTIGDLEKKLSSLKSVTTSAKENSAKLARSASLVKNKETYDELITLTKKMSTLLDKVNLHIQHAAIEGFEKKITEITISSYAKNLAKKKLLSTLKKSVLGLLGFSAEAIFALTPNEGGQSSLTRALLQDTILFGKTYTVREICDRIFSDGTDEERQILGRKIKIVLLLASFNDSRSDHLENKKSFKPTPNKQAPSPLPSSSQ